MNISQHESKVTDSLPELFLFYDTQQNKIVFSNQSLDTFFGTPVTLGEDFEWTDETDDSKAIAAAWQKCLQLKEKESFRFEIKKPTGKGDTIFNFTATGVRLAYQPVQPLLIFLTVQKHILTTDSNGLTEDVRLRNIREQAKKEQAEFIDLAAHDLDAPLRKLSLLIDTLLLKYEKGAAADINGHVQRIQKNLSAMRSLIDGLASLSRAHEGVGEQSYFNIGTVIDEATKGMEDVLKEKKAVITCSSLPETRGNRDQFILLFKLLLENSILFSRHDTAPSIDITYGGLTEDEKFSLGLTGSKNYLKIRINDNGIGFLPDHAEKIFRPFVRLHGKSEFAGNGIGLAICKTIIENHKGIIYAEKNEREGARFLLIIPQINN